MIVFFLTAVCDSYHTSIVMGNPTASAAKEILIDSLRLSDPDPDRSSPLGSIPCLELKTKAQHSSGNVFRDLGFSPEEAANLRIRADLMVRLRKPIKARGLTQAGAAELSGVSQPRVSDLLRGKIDLFSIDTLVNMLGRAGVLVSLVVRPRSKVA